MASLMTKQLSTGWRPAAYGNAAWSQSPSSGAFETAEGTLMIAANTERQFIALCRGLGRADLAEDPRWRDPAGRRANAVELGRESATRPLTLLPPLNQILTHPADARPWAINAYCAGHLIW